VTNAPSIRMRGLVTSPRRGEGGVRGRCSPPTLISPESQEGQSGSDRFAAAGLLSLAWVRESGSDRLAAAGLRSLAWARESGSDRLATAGSLSLVWPRESNQREGHPAPARDRRAACRVPCGARRQQAARQLGHPWPRTVWLSPAAGSAPRRGRGAQDQQQRQEQQQQQQQVQGDCRAWIRVMRSLRRGAIFAAGPERSVSGQRGKSCEERSRVRVPPLPLISHSSALTPGSNP
jgi:hypothetical protein